MQTTKSLEEFFTKTYASRQAISAGFYERLFREIPEARGMFHGDITKQKLMFMMMMGTIAKSQAGVTDIEALGARLQAVHAGHGVSHEHLLIGGEALKDACEEVLEPITAETERHSLYGIIDQIVGAMTSEMVT